MTGPETYGGVTPLGLPYPSPSDLVSQGAGAIKALADAVDAMLSGSYRIHTATDTVTVNANAWSGIGIKTLETSRGSDIVASGNGMVVAKAGMYEFILTIQCGNGNATSVTIGPGVNAGAGPGSAMRASLNPGGASLLIGYSGLVRLAANDYIGAMVSHNATGTLTFTNRRMSLRRVGV